MASWYYVFFFFPNMPQILLIRWGRMTVMNYYSWSILCNLYIVWMSGWVFRDISINCMKNKLHNYLLRCMYQHFNGGRVEVWVSRSVKIYRNFSVIALLRMSALGTFLHFAMEHMSFTAKINWVMIFIILGVLNVF